MKVLYPSLTIDLVIILGSKVILILDFKPLLNAHAKQLLWFKLGIFFSA